jgi:hypothetical protein
MKLEKIEGRMHMNNSEEIIRVGEYFDWESY